MQLAPWRHLRATVVATSVLGFLVVRVLVQSRWSRIRQTGLTVEAKEVVGQIQSLTPANHHDKFDWEVTVMDQGTFI